MGSRTTKKKPSPSVWKDTGAATYALGEGQDGDGAAWLFGLVFGPKTRGSPMAHGPKTEVRAWPRK
ncbi:hypothetical protein C4147_15190 [Clostridioides difficile]|nr:hypothetical protein [Clostridioides difficile]